MWEIRMFRFSISIIAIVVMLGLAGSTVASSIDLKISGPGVVDDTTIKVGQPVSFELYIANDKKYTYMNIGFKMTSQDIKNVVHLIDSGKGYNPAGDVKCWNGFEDKSIWDFGGMHVVERSWDGVLPDTLGFGAICAYKTYDPHERRKCFSWDMRFDEVGTVVVDSTFFPPAGTWVIGEPAHEPAWGGPYVLRIVK